MLKDYAYYRASQIREEVNALITELETDNIANEDINGILASLYRAECELCM